jgi:putative membrane-bound dehydrogenase-like protein
MGAGYKFGAQTLTVPDGFIVEQVAGPPFIDRPISGDFDNDGHLYVSESSGSNDPVEVQLAEKPHRILRLTDTDADGTFDSKTVYADGMMFPEGVLWYRGSVYVSAPPQIWKLTDKDGDGVAEDREVWFDGITLTGCANDLHGPYVGRDGWIYWCKGSFGEQTYERTESDPFVTRAAHIFRRRPEGGEVEPVLTGGMNNPVDVVFSKTGERFLSSTFIRLPSGGERDGLMHAIYGGVYGRENGVLDGHPRTGDLMPVLDHLGAVAPSGLEYYESDALGPNFSGNLFTALFNLHQVTRHELAPEGASFTSQTRVFLESDDLDFHPTDVFEDADGSLIVIDTGGWYKLCCPTSQLHKPDVPGGIYRIRKSGTQPDKDPRGLNLEWASLTSRKLISLLNDERPYVVDRAIESLAFLGNNAIPDISNFLVDTGADSNTKLNLVWALTKIDSLEARKAVRLVLQDNNPDVVQAALHSVSAWKDRGANKQVLIHLESSSLPVRRVAAEALGRIGNASHVAPLLKAAGSFEAVIDRVLRHSITYALIEIGDLEATLAGLSMVNSGCLEAALWALLSMDEKIPDARYGDITQLLAHSDPAVRQVAWQLVENYPGWVESVVEVVQGLLITDGIDSSFIEDSQSGLAKMANHLFVSSFISHCLKWSYSRDFAAAVIRKAEIKNPPADWVAYLNQSLLSLDSVLVSDTLETIRVWNSKFSGVDRFSDSLRSLVNSSEFKTSVRISALSLLAQSSGFNLGPEVYELVLKSLRPSIDPLVRNQAVGILAKLDLNLSLRLQLAQTLSNVGPMELGKLIPLFNGDSVTVVGNALVDSLSVSAAAVVLDRQDILEALSAYPKSIRSRADEAVLTRLNRGGEDAAAELESLLASLPGDGDIRRGQRVFQSARAACSSCHLIGFLGGDLGPELSSVGIIRSQRDLLEAIVFPSASFVQSYESVVLTKTDGSALTGILKDEGRDELLLAAGPGVNIPVSREDVASIDPSAVSLMPVGMHSVLSKQELADLLSFLMSRKGK